MKNILTILFLSITVFSCTKSETAEPAYSSTDKNSLNIEFENRIGDQKLVLGVTKGTNAAGADFTVTKLNYFISNISLKNDKGEIVKFPENYFLIRQDSAKTLVATLKNVPAGNYTEISYVIGVDSTKSVSKNDALTGTLDIANASDMYWSWNSGYIFFKMEGISSVAKTNSKGLKMYQIHVGGFGGKTTVTPNNLKTITKALTNPATVRKNIVPEIHLVTDVTKVFGGANIVRLDSNSVYMAPKLCIPIAQNYTASFKVDHVHNDMR